MYTPSISSNDSLTTERTETFYLAPENSFSDVIGLCFIDTIWKTVPCGRAMTPAMAKVRLSSIHIN